MHRRMLRQRQLRLRKQKWKNKLMQNNALLECVLVGRFLFQVKKSAIIVIFLLLFQQKYTFRVDS